MSTSGCAGEVADPTAGSVGAVSASSPASGPAFSSSSSSAATPVPGSKAPARIDRGWVKAGLVDPGGGDPTRTTPPYENPGSLGHPQAYQGGQADLLGLAAGGPGLVAVGYLARDFRAAAWSSEDGLTWTRSAAFDAEDFSLANAVVAGEPGMVAVGAAGADASVWTSPDGMVWQWHRLETAGSVEPVRMTSVAAWNGGFVAAGYEGSLVGPVRAVFWTSADGQDWRRVPDGSTFANAKVADLARTADGTALVAVGLTGDAKAATGAVSWRSTDGQTWQRSPGTAALQDAVINAITAGPDGLVAVGSDLVSKRAVAWRSIDGRAWEQAPDAPSLDNFGLKIEMRDVASTGTGYLAGGHLLFGTQYPSAVTWTSDDGRRWTRAEDVPAFSQGKIQAVLAGGPGLVAAGSFGSPDFSIPTVWVSAGLSR